jgi:serine/threonine protein kinase
MFFDIDVYINNILIKLNLNKYMKLGKGTYGTVYFFRHQKHNYAIKLSEYYHPNENFAFEKHIYSNYHKSKHKINGIPKCYYSGKTINKYNKKSYNYIILDYAGLLTLGQFSKIIFAEKLQNDSEIKHIIKLIYATGLIIINSLHNKNIICRDIKLDNIIVSDHILSYLITRLKVNALRSSIPQFIREILPYNTTYKDINTFFLNKNYKNIIQFIDTGLFCDLTELHSTPTFDINHDKWYSNFQNMDPFDPLFASNINYLFPMAIFNFSSIVNHYDAENKTKLKNIIKNLLKLSDHWSYSIIFVTFFYSFFGNLREDLDKISIKMRDHFCSKTMYTYNHVDFLMFDVSTQENEKKIILKNNIIDKIKQYDFKFYNLIYACLKYPIEISQILLDYTDKKHKYLPFKLKFNDHQLVTTEENVNIITEKIDNIYLSILNDIENDM